MIKLKKKTNSRREQLFYILMKKPKLLKYGFSNIEKLKAIFHL